MFFRKIYLCNSIYNMQIIHSTFNSQLSTFYFSGTLALALSVRVEKLPF